MSTPINTISLKDRRPIWCCACNETVLARLTNCAEIYPHRNDLTDVPRWICDKCGNSVGTHHKSNTPLKPLGCIPTPEVRAARVELHKHIDEVWMSGAAARSDVYRIISDKLGRVFHIGDVRSIEEAKMIKQLITMIRWGAPF